MPEPTHADESMMRLGPQQTGMHVGQANAGMILTTRDIAGDALDSRELLDLDPGALLCQLED